MKRRGKLEVLIVALTVMVSQALVLAGDTWVNGYYRKDGTYVNGHYRSKPDGNPYNNRGSWSRSSSSSRYSTPRTPTYTPKSSYGTRSHGIGSLGNSTRSKTYTAPGIRNYKSNSVRGYIKRDGTYVAPHFRSSPNNSVNDNWSTRGNSNPFTGKQGTKKGSSLYVW